eukprot:237800-Alexandrium_andersonii.AAC.1
MASPDHVEKSLIKQLIFEGLRHEHTGTIKSMVGEGGQQRVLCAAGSLGLAGASQGCHPGNGQLGRVGQVWLRGVFPQGRPAGLGSGFTR